LSLRILAAILLPAFSWAATTVVDLFPSDRLTVPDRAQRTGLRLNLPLPDCSVQVTVCREYTLLNQTDGFSIRPRAAVRFSAPVNVATLADGVFFEPVGPRERVHGAHGRIGIDQAVYDPATNTLYAKPANVLAAGRRYELVVTSSVLDASGAPVAPATSTFTTMSATASVEDARAVALSTTPSVQMAGEFAISDLSALVLHEQIATNPTRFSDVSLPLDPTLLSGVGRIVIGSFRSPQLFRGTPTTEEIGFNVILPAGPKPAAGYPVVIFGHGFGDSRFGGPTAVAPALNRAGFAVVAIDAVGHGYGPLSTVIFTDRAGKQTSIPALGRSIDLNGDGTIEANEGCAIETPVPIGLRDCFRQTVVDLMQLARVVRDGLPELDGSHIYYGGQSLGAMYGTMFTAAEPTVRAAALNVGGATTVEIARLSPAYRELAIETLSLNVPSLLNKGTSYDEDYVLPGQPVHVVTVPGAIEIQNALELSEWLSIPGDPIAFAPQLAKRPVLIQIARADRTMPNPASTLWIRAAGLAGNTWMYRHDLARAKDPTLPLDPHPFLVLFVSLGASGVQLPSTTGLAISLDAQNQVANFFGTDGATIPDPNLFSRFLLGTAVFERPASLPVDLGFSQ
jgi:pimeloyl-ACP methyl ester carboxylesterase